MPKSGPAYRRIKPATPRELNQIAERMVAAPSEVEAQKLKQEYLKAFYGKSVHAEGTAGQQEYLRGVE